MKFVKYFSIGSLLIGLTGFAFAEDGFERTKQFKENFRAEQARLWGPDSSEQGKQKVAQEERQDRQEQADK